MRSRGEYIYLGKTQRWYQYDELSGAVIRVPKRAILWFNGLRPLVNQCVWLRKTAPYHSCSQVKSVFSKRILFNSSCSQVKSVFFKRILFNSDTRNGQIIQC